MRKRRGRDLLRKGRDQQKNKKKKKKEKKNNQQQNNPPPTQTKNHRLLCKKRGRRRKGLQGGNRSKRPAGIFNLTTGEEVSQACIRRKETRSPGGLESRRKGLGKTEVTVASKAEELRRKIIGTTLAKQNHMSSPRDI